MPTRERPIDRATQIAHRDISRVGEELRTARVGSGLSLRFVGKRVGRSATQVMRIERGLVPNLSVRQIARIGGVVGLDVRLRAYPGPDPVRDTAQVRLLGRLEARLHDSLTLRTEVPLPIEGDQRAWDGWINGFVDLPGNSAGIPVDAETRLQDLQALLRRLALKVRDSGAEHVLLVLADTRTNRYALAHANPIFTATFPVSARRALAALAAGRHPGGSSVIFL